MECENDDNHDKDAENHDGFECLENKLPCTRSSSRRQRAPEDEGAGASERGVGPRQVDGQTDLIHLCVCVYVCIYTYMYIYMYYTYIHIHIHMCVCVYIYIYDYIMIC